jgi:hypothetical protein
MSWGTLGEVLGGGIDREGAYDQGRMQRARTEEALNRARIERDKALARENVRAGDSEALLAGDADLARELILGNLGSDFSAVQHGRLRGQELGFRETIANPETPMDVRQITAQAVSGRPEPYLRSMGQGHYTDIRDPDAGTLANELGVAQTDAAVALAGQRRTPRASSSEPLVQALDPETGETVFMPRSQAAGMQPPPRGTPPEREALSRAMSNVARILSDPFATEDERAAAMAELQRLGTEGFAPDADPESALGDVLSEPETELPEGVPPGSRLVGYTGIGESVYETPDGRRLVAGFD